MMSPSEISTLLKTELLGILPDEDEVFLSGGNDFPKGSESRRAYSVLAGNIVSGKRKLFDATKKYTGFLGSIRRGLRGSL